MHYFFYLFPLKIFLELVVLAEMVGEVVIVTLLVSEGDQVVIVVMGLLMDKVEEVEMALTAISLETTVEGVVTVVHQGKAVTEVLAILARDSGKSGNSTYAR